jgi:hypothetical protein
VRAQARPARARAAPRGRSRWTGGPAGRRGRRCPGRPHPHRARGRWRCPGPSAESWCAATAATTRPRCCGWPRRPAGRCWPSHPPARAAAPTRCRPTRTCSTCPGSWPATGPISSCPLGVPAFPVARPPSWPARALPPGTSSWPRAPGGGPIRPAAPPTWPPRSSWPGSRGGPGRRGTIRRRDPVVPGRVPGWVPGWRRTRPRAPRPTRSSTPAPRSPSRGWPVTWPPRCPPGPCCGPPP